MSIRRQAAGALARAAPSFMSSSLRSRSMVDTNGATSRESRYYLLSAALAPEQFNAAVRSHWGIENGLHWTLDVIMGEDNARNRKDNGPQNLALLRKTVLNLAKIEPSKGSMRGKLKASISTSWM
ncbi:ISAs1 family transposase [Vineibacter terrae]|nr:ISAs1 family transposase [Vineibacter terrae]